MSLATLLEPATRRGRRPIDADRRRRLVHIAAAYRLRVERWTPEEVAVAYGVSRQTVYNWTRLALTYDDPEVLGLRRAAGLPDEPGGR